MRLKNPLLCRIMTYVAVLGAWLLPMAAVICIPGISEFVKVAVSSVCALGLQAYLFCNFAVLMALDIFLGTLQGYKDACRQYPLETDAKTLENRLSRFGTACDPVALQPKPQILRYKSTAPITVYSSGIEKVVAVYRCGLLTKEEYHNILNSADANSRALTGKKKHRLLDKAQKSSPLNRVTVVLILATAVEPGLSQSLYDLICRREGDGFDAAVLPCVVDLAAKTCVFNSSRLPYFGMQYPVKNRGIHLIKKYIFGGSFPEGTGMLIEELEDFDSEKTLWSFWRELKQQWRDQKRKTKKSLAKMSHGQMMVEEDAILLKWEDRGTEWALRWEDEGKTPVVTVSDLWEYPKVRPMSKKHLALLKDRIDHHFTQQGHRVRFVTPEEEC